MKHNFFINQLVVPTVDIEDDGLCIEKGTICRIVTIDEYVGYIKIQNITNNLYAWIYEENLEPKLFRIFMGGTTQGFDWREILEERFKDDTNVELFNPVVDNWTCERVRIENEYKDECELCLFVVTPYMGGIYSIAEAVDLSNKRPENLIFAYIDHFVDGKEIRYFTKEMKHSLDVTARLINKNGGKVFTSLDDVEKYIREFIL